MNNILETYYNYGLLESNPNQIEKVSLENIQRDAVAHTYTVGSVYYERGFPVGMVYKIEGSVLFLIAFEERRGYDINRFQNNLYSFNEMELPPQKHVLWHIPTIEEMKEFYELGLVETFNSIVVSLPETDFFHEDEVDFDDEEEFEKFIYWRRRYLESHPNPDNKYRIEYNQEYTSSSTKSKRNDYFFTFEFGSGRISYTGSYMRFKLFGKVKI